MENPSQSTSSAAAASELIGRLPAEHKFALGGLLAALLGKKADYWTDAFCRQHLQRVARSMLCLEHEQSEGLTPIFEQGNHADIDAFVKLLPPGEHERAALLLGLLVLTVVSEDIPETVGYDARSRQLLVDASVAMDVPWSRMALAEGELASTMRAQAVARARDGGSSGGSAPGSGRAGSTPGSGPGSGGSGGAGTGGASGAQERGSGEAASGSTGGAGFKSLVSAKWRKRIAVAGMGVASGVAVGLTAGLAAPAVLAGLGAVGTGISGIGSLGVVGTALGGGIATTAAVLQGAIGVTVVTTIFGATGAGLASYKMDRRLGDVKEFEFAQPRAAALLANPADPADPADPTNPPTPADPAKGAHAGAGTEGLVVCLCVSGWLVSDEDAPQEHWWGEGEGEAAEQAKEEGGAAEAGVCATNLTSPRPSWPSPPPPLAPTPPPGTPGTGAAAGGTDAGERAEELIGWLVEMGFPRAAAAAAVKSCGTGNPEVIVEQLVSSGVVPSLDAAVAASASAPGGGSGGGSGSDAPGYAANYPAGSSGAAGEELSTQASALDLGRSPHERRPSLALADQSYPMALPPSRVSAPSEAARGAAAAAGASVAAGTSAVKGSLGGAASTVVGAVGEVASTAASPLASTSALIASFIEVDTPKRTALECLPYAEHHVLLWESAELRILGKALGRIAASEALAVVASQTLRQTFLASLMAAVAVPAYILKACDILDNPWAVSFKRAQKAGELLATVLLERTHGCRPVILVGFGLGARLIYDAAMCLADALEAGDPRAAGIVQHIVLMGLPATCEPVRWARIRAVCAGRVVNCYRPNDLVLAMVHRAANLALGVAGISEVRAPGIENYDVSDVVSAHHKYRHATGAVLQLVGLDEPQ